MATIERQFSEAARQELLDRASGSVIKAVVSDMATTSMGVWPIEQYVQAPRQIMEIATQFDDRHAEIRTLAARSKVAVIESAPYGQAAQDQLLFAVHGVLDDIGGLLARAFPASDDAVSKLLTHEKAVIERIIRRRYGDRELRHELETVAEGRKDGGMATAPRPNSRPRNNRKMPIDRVLGVMEKEKRTQLRRQLLTDRELDEQMAAQLYGLSAQDLREPVNEELAKLGHGSVSAKTISRCATYRSWRPYRRSLPAPAAAADYGSAFTQLGERNPTANDFADADVIANGLAERSGRRLRSGSRSRSENDRAADEWAKSAGSALPPAD